MQAYERLAQNSEAILFISVASALSRGYQAALEAKEMAREKLPQVTIEVIDSKTVCSSQVLIALEAGKVASQGKGVAETTQLVNGMILRMNDISTRDTLFYLDKGGRILEAKSWAEAELKNSFRAIVEIDGSTGGVTKPVARAKTKTEAMEKMVDIAKQRVGDKRLHAAVIHANVPDQAAELKRMVLSQLQRDEFYVSEAFPVTAMHNGEGLIDFGFYCSG